MTLKSQMKVSIELISDYLVLDSHDYIPVTDVDEALESWKALTTMFNLSFWASVMLIDIQRSRTMVSFTESLGQLSQRPFTACHLSHGCERRKSKG